MSSLPSPSSLPHLPDDALTSVLSTLFEPSPPLQTLALPILRSTTFPSYAVLIAAIHTLLTSLASTDVETLSAILCAHPRLGEKKVDSALSRSEQAQLKGNEEEGKMLEGLNKEYESVFPGLRYVYVRTLYLFGSNLRDAVLC
jgi:2-oxo-4-hydroxy-4-carboxy--5-ureidoimidazoline (OHCU) decarboxylase